MATLMATRKEQNQNMVDCQELLLIGLRKCNAADQLAILLPEQLEYIIDLTTNQ